MDPVTRQILFGNEPGNFSIHNQTSRIIEPPRYQHRKANGNHHPLTFWQQSFKNLDRGLLYPGRKEGILATVTCNAEFGQAED